MDLYFLLNFVSDLDSLTIPKGSEIILNLYGLHKDPRIWNDPWKFNPDRFLPDEFSKVPHHAYIPWSTGVRSCPGKRNNENPKNLL